MATGSSKAVVAALLANSGIAVSKFVAFLLTGAASMLAESVHSVADAGNQALLLLGSRRGSAPPDERHPFGYGRERYFWAFVVAIVLFSLGSLFALYEGYQKLRDPHEIEGALVAVVVLIVALVLEAFSLRTAVQETKKVMRPGEGWLQFVRRTKAPELPTVLLEDIGAMFGLVFALVGVVLAAVTDNPRWDALGSVVIGLLLGVIAAIIAVEMKSLLIGEGAEPEVTAQIRSRIEADPDVRRLIRLQTLQVGPTDVLVAAKIELDQELTSAEVAGRIDRIERDLQRAVPIARHVFLEPGLTPATPTAGSGNGGSKTS